MDFKLYNKPVPAKPKKLAFAIRAVKLTSGAVALAACDPVTGKVHPDGWLVKFKKDGTLYFYHTINPALQLPVDGNGRLKIALR